MTILPVAKIVGLTLLACLGPLGLAPVHAAGTCAVFGGLWLSSGIGYAPKSNVAFTLSINCITGGTITTDGVLSIASCVVSRGTGFITGVGSISIETVGEEFVVTGAATGAGRFIPLPDNSTNPPGNSCSSGTAYVFQVLGGIAWPS